MPKVPDRPLSYGEILEKARKLSKDRTEGSKSFAKITYVRASKSAPTGFIKRTRLKDKALISDDIARFRHLRDIRKEY